MIAVFVGPSLPGDAAAALAAIPSLALLPPAAQGDIYRIVGKRPDAIVLIDGYFNEVPAPWHKEILWALSSGIPVIGASSMGALRAAELDGFGMIGIGEIYEAYVRQDIVADDEVVLVHGDAASGFVPFSVPLVDIRATFRAAQAAGLATPAEVAELVGIAKALFYPERTYEAIFERCPPRRRLAALRRWVDENAFSQKALDAQAAIAFARSGACLPFVEVDWQFERTAMWDELTRKHSRAQEDCHDFTHDDRIDALQGDRAQYNRLMIGALARLLAINHARQSGRKVTEDDLLRTLARIRAERSLEHPAALMEWMAANELTSDRLMYLLEAETLLTEAIEGFASDLHPMLIDQLRLEGLFARAPYPVPIDDHGDRANDRTNAHSLRA
jgi:hypothetical protein